MDAGDMLAGMTYQDGETYVELVGTIKGLFNVYYALSVAAAGLTALNHSKANTAELAVESALFYPYKGYALTYVEFKAYLGIK